MELYITFITNEKTMPGDPDHVYTYLLYASFPDIYAGYLDGLFSQTQKKVS